MKKLILILVVVAVALVGYFYYYLPKANNDTGGVACTMEAKLCPDGSYVGRTGPKCEFAACPTVPVGTSGSGINGNVLLGPTCPVERVPPDPQCAERPFATKLAITLVGSTKIIKEFSSDVNGKFSVDVSAGTYTVGPSASANMLPRCSLTGPIQVTTGKYTNATISCDTGIR